MEVSGYLWFERLLWIASGDVHGNLFLRVAVMIFPFRQRCCSYMHRIFIGVRGIKENLKLLGVKLGSTWHIVKTLELYVNCRTAWQSQKIIYYVVTQFHRFGIIVLSDI